MCFLLLGASLDRLDSVTRNKYLHCGANRFSNYAAIGNALQQQPAKQVLRNHLAFVWVGSPFFCGSPITAANIAELHEQFSLARAGVTDDVNSPNRFIVIFSTAHIKGSYPVVHGPLLIRR